MLTTIEFKTALERQKTIAAGCIMGRHLRLILHGKAAGVPEIRQAVEAVRNRGHRLDVRVTWEAGDSIRYAKEAAADGVETVVAGGGDGTLNEVAAGVVDGSGPPSCCLGLLPLGTANDFAKACGIPVDNPEAALMLAAEGEVSPTVCPFFSLSAILLSPATAMTVGTQSKCDITSLTMVPLGILPGNLARQGTRKPPSQLVVFSLANQVTPASGQVA